MKQHKPAYKVVKTKSYKKAIEVLQQLVGNRYIDLVNKVDWALERKPHKYTPTGEEGYYILNSVRLFGSEFPTIEVIYHVSDHIDEMTVRLLTMRYVK